MFDELFGLNFLDIRLKLVYVKEGQYDCHVIHDGEDFVKLQFPPHQIRLIDESEHYSLQQIWDKMGDGIGQICKAIYGHFLIKGHQTFNAVAIKQEIEDIEPSQMEEEDIAMEPVVNFVESITTDSAVHHVEEYDAATPDNAVAETPESHSDANLNGLASNKRRYEEGDGREHEQEAPPRKRMKRDHDRNVLSEFIDIASETEGGNRNIVKEEKIKNWYDDWDHSAIVQWIGEIEGGRFAKYVNKLSHAFAEEEIRGSDLPLITEQNWKEWGILKFRDRKDLHKCVQHLTVRLA